MTVCMRWLPNIATWFTSFCCWNCGLLVPIFRAILEIPLSCHKRFRITLPHLATIKRRRKSSKSQAQCGSPGTRIMVVTSSETFSLDINHTTCLFDGQIRTSGRWATQVTIASIGIIGSVPWEPQIFDMLTMYYVMFSLWLWFCWITHACGQWSIQNISHHIPTMVVTNNKPSPFFKAV